MKRVDLGRNVETFRRESLRAPVPGERAGAKKTAGTRNQGELGGGLETARIQSEGRGGGTGGGGSTPHPGGLVQDSGMVKGYGRPRSAARLIYSRADHSGEGCAVQLCTAPGGEHLSDHSTFPGR